MKKPGTTVIFLVLLIITIFFDARSQENPSLNVLQLRLINVSLTASTTSRISFISTPTQLVSAFGNPLSIENVYSELNDTNHKVYTYDGAKFYFDGSIIEYFTITNPNFSICVHRNRSCYSLKVGDPIDRLQEVGPLSFNASKDGRIFFKLKHYDNANRTTIEVDEMLIFSHQNGIITKITQQ